MRRARRDAPYPTATLTANLEALKQLNALRKLQATAIGVAVGATNRRNDAHGVMMDWVRQLRGIASVAFRNQPEQAQKLDFQQERCSSGTGGTGHRPVAAGDPSTALRAPGRHPLVQEISVPKLSGKLPPRTAKLAVPPRIQSNRSGSVQRWPHLLLLISTSVFGSIQSRLDTNQHQEGRNWKPAGPETTLRS